MSSSDQSSRHIGSLCLQELQAKLFGGDAELDELGLVDPNRIVVCFGCVSHRVSEVLDYRVLGLDGLLHLLADLVYSVLVEAGPLDQLSELNVLALELSLSDGQDLIEH